MRLGRIRLAKISNFSAKSLHGFIAANTSPGAAIKTDGWCAYPGAPGVDHDPHVIGKMAARIAAKPITYKMLILPEEKG
jgi:hypothetical protein